MTAEEYWATSTDPEGMLTVLPNDFGIARRPVVLAGFAERGRLPELLSPDLRMQFVAYARWVFGLRPRPLPIELPVFDPTAVSDGNVVAVEDRIRFAMSGTNLEWWQFLGLTIAEALEEPVVNVWQSPGASARAWYSRQADALRDALGNPFAPVEWSANWRSETVTALATGIHFDNAFDRLPILADALEEAGCDDADVLTHCRGPGPHARGCWVVDAARGKW